MNRTEFKQTKRNQVKRIAKRGKYDKEAVYSILDVGITLIVSMINCDL